MSAKILKPIALLVLVLVAVNQPMPQSKKDAPVKILGCARAENVDISDYSRDRLTTNVWDGDRKPVFTERQLKILLQEKYKLALFLQIKADIHFFEKKGGTPLAVKYASASNDGDVLLENYFLRELLKGTIRGENAPRYLGELYSLPDPATPFNPRESLVKKEYYAFTVLLAHELSHINQTVYGTATQSTKQYELEADKRAGAILRIAHTPLREPSATREQLKSGLQEVSEMYRIGADYLFDLGDFEFTDEATHGLPTERMEAFLSGINSVTGLLRRCYLNTEAITKLDQMKGDWSNGKAKLRAELDSMVPEFFKLGIDPAIVVVITDKSCDLPTESSRWPLYHKRFEP